MFNYSIKVYPINNPKGKQVAFADICINEVMVVKGFKVFDGSQGLFAKVPDTKGLDKEQKETYWPNVIFLEDKEGDEKQGPVQKEILKAIVDAYLETKQTSTTSVRGNAAAANAAANTSSKPAEKSASKPAGSKRAW